MIAVTLSDAVVRVDGWTAGMYPLGEYSLKRRKSPEMLSEERRRASAMGRPPSSVRQFEYIRQTVLTEDDAHPGTVWFMAGLWPRVKGWLDGHRMDYTVDDRRNPAIRPEPDYSRIADVQFRPGQPEALASITGSDCGIIAASVGFGKSFLIAQLCKVYPTLNIVVTTNTVSVIKQLYRDIADELPGEVGMLTGSKDTTPGKRIVVSTLDSLPKIPADKVQLLLVDECHCLGAASYSKAVAGFVFARRFGFSATPVRNDGTEKVMESLVGPVIYRTTYEQGVFDGMLTPVKYIMLPCEKCPSFLRENSASLPNYVVQRYAYYRNSARNRLIANAVSAIREVFSGQILIVVSTVEHAIALSQLLPYFRVAHSESYDAKDMADKFAREYPKLDFRKYELKEKDNDMLLNAFAKGTLRYLISTKIIRQGVNFRHLQCLIRADATRSEIDCFQIPGRLSRLDEGKDVSYLIDIDDRFTPLAQYKSKMRKKEYDDYKWQEISTEELLDGLKRADRPGDPGFAQRAAPGDKHGEDREES